MRKIYASFLFTMGVCTLTQAQIVYTDINPDETYSLDQMYLLDVNNDGTDDYIIEQTDSVVGGNPLEGVQLRSIGSVNEAVYETTTLTFLASIPAGSVIDPTLLWTVPSPTLPAGGVITIGSNSIPAGDWSDQLDHYGGLFFTVGPNSFYGWVRFSVNSTGTGFTVKDYAYHSTTDQPLLAGATVDGVEENELTGFTLQQMGSTVMIQNNLSTENTIEIFDLTGKLLENRTMNTLSATFDFNDYSNGIYIIRCSNEKGTREFKVGMSK